MADWIICKAFFQNSEQKTARVNVCAFSGAADDAPQTTKASGIFGGVSVILDEDFSYHYDGRTAPDKMTRIQTTEKLIALKNDLERCRDHYDLCITMANTHKRDDQLSTYERHLKSMIGHYRAMYEELSPIIMMLRALEMGHSNAGHKVWLNTDK